MFSNPEYFDGVPWQHEIDEMEARERIARHDVQFNKSLARLAFSLITAFSMSTAPAYKIGLAILTTETYAVARSRNYGEPELQ